MGCARIGWLLDFMAPISGMSTFSPLDRIHWDVITMAFGGIIFVGVVFWLTLMFGCACCKKTKKEEPEPVHIHEGPKSVTAIPNGSRHGSRHSDRDFSSRFAIGERRPRALKKIGRGKMSDRGSYRRVHKHFSDKLHVHPSVEPPGARQVCEVKRYDVRYEEKMNKEKERQKEKDRERRAQKERDRQWLMKRREKSLQQRLAKKKKMEHESEEEEEQAIPVEPKESETPKKPTVDDVKKKVDKSIRQTASIRISAVDRPEVPKLVKSVIETKATVTSTRRKSVTEDGLWLPPSLREVPTPEKSVQSTTAEQPSKERETSAAKDNKRPVADRSIRSIRPQSASARTMPSQSVKPDKDNDVSLARKIENAQPKDRKPNADN